MKKKKLPIFRKKEVTVKEYPKEEIATPSVPFETTDRGLVSRLQEMGFTVKHVASPFGERKVKLYIFEASKEEVEEALSRIT